MTRRSLIFIAVLCALTVPTVTRAQQTPPPRVRREIPGFDFRKDGVWRRQARAVRAVRARLLSRRNFGALNAPMAAAGAPLASGAAVSGVLRVPAILFKFKDTPAAQLRTATQYNQVLFAASPTGASAGRPYTYRSYYEQLSNGLLSVQGQTYGYAALDSNEVTYTGGSNCTGNPYGSSNCNGLFDNSDPVSPVTRMQNGLREALRKLDNQVDWTQYDFDGDSYVDLVAFMHPPLDGACGGATNNHLWSHRFSLTGTAYVTHSTNAQGVPIKVSDYILESGVGGSDGCDASQIMPVGTVSHETGHGFGLPDLYDTDNASEGVGEYSLMGSGNYTSGISPSRMDAWSLNELGWVTVVPIPTGGTYAFGPAPTSDTAFYVPVGGANPRGEYFLLENRQAVLSDSAVVHYHCQVWFNSGTPPPCGGGLLIYHVDSAQIVAGVTTPGPNDDFNHVNVGPIHGLAVVQADGRGNLDADPNAACSGAGPGCSDRGDAGDLYPGPTGNVAFTPTSFGCGDPVRRRYVSPVPGFPHAELGAQRERRGHAVHGGRSHPSGLRLLVRGAVAQLQLHGARHAGDPHRDACTVAPGSLHRHERRQDHGLGVERRVRDRGHAGDPHGCRHQRPAHVPGLGGRYRHEEPEHHAAHE